MLTVEIKINGSLLSYLYILNVTDKYAADIDAKELAEKHQDLYHCELYLIGKEKVLKAEVKHERIDGAEVLVTKALNAFLKMSEYTGKYT